MTVFWRGAWHNVTELHLLWHMFSSGMENVPRSWWVELEEAS